MELKNIFKMTKTDRYTQDGRDELAKLQETEDVKYKTGDISQKTGLQKQPDGSWAPPKGGAAPKMGSPEFNEKYGLTKRDVATGKEIDRIYEKHQKRIKELKAKGYTDEQIENDKIYQQTKEDMRNVGKNKPELSQTDGKGNKVEIKITEAKGGGFYIDKYVNGRLIGINNANTRESAEAKAQSMMEQHMADPEYKTDTKGGKPAAKESKPAEEQTKVEPKHTLEVGSEVKFKRSGQPITIKKIENFEGTPIVVGEFDNNGKRETNRFRLDELDYEQKEERKDLVSGNSLEEGRTVNFKKTGQPIKIKKVEYYGSTPIIVGEYEHNGKTETNRFRMDEIETPDAAPRVLTGDCKIRIRK